jgi:hypothetical protein
MARATVRALPEPPAASAAAMPGRYRVNINLGGVLTTKAED